MRHPSRHLALLLVVAIVVSAVTVAACGEPRSGSSADRRSSSESSSTAGTSSATGTGTRTGFSSASSETGEAKPLTANDADAIEQQLDAIEKQLDSLGMPGDSDFEQIEDNLK